MGSVLAYKLSMAGHKVILLEGNEQPGGLSTWYHFDDFVWDKYYHVILQSDDYLIDLIDELGLCPKLHWEETRTGFLWQGKLISMSNYKEFLHFPPLNLWQKIRFASGVLYNNHFTIPKKIEGISAKNYLVKVFGEKVYQTIWDPLLQSKFGALKDEVPATIIWSTMKRYATTRSKKDGKEYMGHLKGGGLVVLFEALFKKIRTNGGEIHTHQKVVSINHLKNGVEVKTSETTFRFDQLISTIPTAQLQKIAPEIKDLYPDSPRPRYLGVIRMALVLKRSLSPYYITNLIDVGNPFTGIIEVSRLGDIKEFNGHHFVMIPRYDLPSSNWFDKSDEEIKQIFIAQLKKSFPDIEDNIINTYVHRERLVQALWIESPPPHDKAAHTPDRRIWNVNNELAGHSTLNNNCVVKVTKRLMEEWKHPLD